MADEDTRNDTGDRRDAEESRTGRALIGAGLAVAAGAATFLLAKRATETSERPDISDAPDHVYRSGNKADYGLVGRTVTINRSRDELYREWRDFSKFPRFMDNVERIITLGDGRSKWTIKAPLGTDVEVVTKITEDRPGETIAWVSEPDSQITTEGRVEFSDAGPGRGTAVRLTMRYSPPGGIVGKGIAKVLQREPDVQARRDLRRFKQLMETGEIPVNASPSGRKSESPTQPTI